MKFVFVSIIVCIVLVSPQASRAAEPIDIGSRLEPLFDRHLIDQLKGKAELRLHSPTAREVAIVHDEPWEGNASGYPTVLKDGDVYRMYYRGHKYVYDDKGLRQAQSEVTCYAESDDGIHWTKPKLQLFDWPGAKINNIIWRGVGVHNFGPFIDTNPAAAPEARYKAVGGNVNSGLHAFHSADGIHWKQVSEEPIFTEGAFDSHNTALWDPARGKYAMYIRYFSEGKFKGLRSIAVTYSDDFKTWSKPQPLAYPDSPPQQMYTNGILPYYRAPHLLVGFPTRYVARKMTEHGRNLDPVELRAKLTKAYARVGSDLTDGLFMTSRDGVSFRRWDEAFFRPGPQQAGRWIYGDNYQCYGLVETKPDPSDGPREISFYLSEGSWRDGETLMRRYSVRVDGFVSVQAPLSGGEVITKPLTFKGNKLVVNYATSAAGNLRVEIQDADGKPIPGFSLADCQEYFGDTLDQTISWQNGSDLGKLAGKPIRLRFVLSDGDLYSFQFQQ